MVDYNATLPLTKVKRDLTDLVRQVDEFQDVVAITKNGFPTAVLLSEDYYEGLIETIEILSNPKIMASLKKSKRQIEQNKLVNEDKAWG